MAKAHTANTFVPSPKAASAINDTRGRRLIIHFDTVGTVLDIKKEDIVIGKQLPKWWLFLYMG